MSCRDAACTLGVNFLADGPLMSPGYALLDLLIALLAGTGIGLERTFRGRAAGARTYALVCTASALLLVMMHWPAEWVAPGTHSLDGLDPTRIVQGILTGIGFLGAGVIVRDGYSVRGLTTAASIWATAAIGIVIGAGYLIPGVLFSIATICILSYMRKLENMVTAQHHVRCQVSCAMGEPMSESQLRQLFAEHRFNVKELSYEMNSQTKEFRYSADMWATGKKHASHLAETLRTTPGVTGFLIAPARD
jgi:putative Mg2+ transporter-C (MgtC) family protein